TQAFYIFCFVILVVLFVKWFLKYLNNKMLINRVLKNSQNGTIFEKSTINLSKYNKE
ncbi:MAG: hypothetical protein RLZZ414_2026, partial [Bacteroidota bacterium]